MKVHFIIVDVNDSAVDAQLDYISTQAAGQSPGKAGALGGKATLDLPDDTWILTTTLLPAEHNDDLVRLRKINGSSEWQIDNPACRITRSGAEITLTATVGRLRPAPIIHIPDDQIAKTKGDPPGVLVYDTGAGFIYHSLFADGYKPFNRLEHPILDPKTCPDAEEWQRLRVKPVDLPDPKTAGRFFHLEYGDPKGGPRLFLSLYLPNPSPRAALDCVVFFSPSTALDKFPIDRFPYRGKYPYGMTKTDQAYPRHPQNYLFSGVHLVHQHVAAGSTAALVMPVAVYGDWSLFQTPEGLHRLLLECTLFLHRELLTTRFANARPVGKTYLNAGGSVKTATAMGVGAGASVFGVFDPVPRLGRVVAACFSSGSVALQALLTGKPLPDGFTQARSGTSASFNSIFKEVWDIDGAHAPYHKYPAFEKALWNWVRAGDRRFRLYHSQYTGGDRDSLAVEPLNKLTRSDDLVIRAEVTEKGQKLWAHERHAEDGSWSSVRFADGYLSSGNTTSTRPYWMLNDSHHFLPKLAFGHASLLFTRRYHHKG